MPCRLCSPRSVVSLLLGAVALGGGLLLAGGAAPAPTPAPATSPLPVAAPVWKMDAVHSAALFRVQHLGAGLFWGRFNVLEGTVTFDPAQPDSLAFDVAIPIDSVDSGNENLDNHLKSPDFFAAKDHPKMTFKSTKVAVAGTNKFKVTGDMTMHGVTKEITADVDFFGAADMGRGLRAGFEARFKVKRSEFDMNWGVENGALGDEVDVIVGMEVIAE